MKNTCIAYLYRDASNYKSHNEAVVKGILSEEDIRTILECRFEGEWFVPNKVGLPEKRFDDGWTDDDHPYFELDEDSFSETDDDPTVEITAEELVQAFEEHRNDW